MPQADELISAQTAETLTRQLAAITGSHMPALTAASRAFDGLSLRERSDHLRDALLEDIPGDYEQLAAVIRAAAESAEFTGWLIWPVTSAVAARARTEATHQAFADALHLLAELTHRLTAEFAIRALLRHDLDAALSIITEWTTSPDEHVRRLASEGTRPYLPWAVRIPQLTKQPGITVPILNTLYKDKSEYVRRSVANHLNDLSRDIPDVVVETARSWLADPDETTPWVVRHGLRTLIKKGHPAALELLGFGPAEIEVSGPYLERTEVPWGGALTFRAELHNTGEEPAQLAIDYVIHHRKANGTTTAKTFKLTTGALGPGECLSVQRKHSFRMITTRRYYPGAHAVALQINGIATEQRSFELLPEERGRPPLDDLSTAASS